jgi:hypothetical protein
MEESMSSTDPCTGKALERLERVRYVSGLVLGVDEFRAEQGYFRKRLRRHNLLLHGWGIVCGLGVTANSEPWIVFVESGYAIDQWGEEIVLDVAQVADARPHCHGRDDCTLYVAISYRAIPSSLVPVPTIHGDGGEEAMQHSRWIDGYELALLEQCPTWVESAPGGSLEDEANNPWIVLGQIIVDANGNVSVHRCRQRRRLRRD